MVSLDSNVKALVNLFKRYLAAPDKFRFSSNIREMAMKKGKTSWNDFK